MEIKEKQLESSIDGFYFWEIIWECESSGHCSGNEVLIGRSLHIRAGENLIRYKADIVPKNRLRIK